MSKVCYLKSFNSVVLSLRWPEFKVIVHGGSRMVKINWKFKAAVSVDVLEPFFDQR